MNSMSIADLIVKLTEQGIAIKFAPNHYDIETRSVVNACHLVSMTGPGVEHKNCTAIDKDPITALVEAAKLATFAGWCKLEEAEGEEVAK